MLFSAFSAALSLRIICKAKAAICTELHVKTISLAETLRSSSGDDWMTSGLRNYCDNECVSLICNPFVCVCVCTSIILFWWLVISCAYDDSPEAKCRSLSAPISSAVCICWGSSALWVKSLFYCLFVLCLVFMCIWLNYSTSDNLASLLHGVLIVMIRVACYQS